MVYNSKTRIGLYVLYVILVITIQLNFIIGGFFLSLHIFLAVFTLLLYFIQFRIKIGQGYITYQILLLKKPMYEKLLYPDQIMQIKFKRIGWVTKYSIIKVKNGPNIRVVNFEPKTVFIDLIEFAKENSITIIKTKDYLILER